MLLLGAGPGAALGALVDWLFRRGTGDKLALAVQRGNDLRASLTETEATLTLERARRVQDCARLEEDLRGSEALRHSQAQRYETVIRGKDLVLARYRKQEAEHATGDTLADLADDLGRDGLLPLPDSGDPGQPAGARDDGPAGPVPGPPAGPAPPVASGKSV